MLKLNLPKQNTLFITLICLFLYVNFCICSSIMDLNSLKSSEVDALLKRACGGKISGCPEMGVEDEMDSESNRRVLAMQKRYISYDTLKRDSVPCNEPGASYYACRGGGEANHYNRGCEVITRCARQVNDINS